MSDPGESGGTAHGLNAFLPVTASSTAGLLSSAMIEVAQWIKDSAGCFLGHVKMAVMFGDRTVTFNLTDLGTGVEQHGPLAEGVRIDIRFMAAVVDVNRDELAERMKNSLVSKGFKMKNKNVIELE